VSFVRLRPSLSVVDTMERCDALCGLLSVEDRPFSGGLGFADWRLGGAVAHAVRSGFFGVERGERLLVPTSGRLPFPRVFVVGLGHASRLDLDAFEETAEAAVDMLRRAGAHAAALSVSHLPPRLAADADEIIERALANAGPGSWAWFYGEDEEP
jgi:hypothetical protein